MKGGDVPGWWFRYFPPFCSLFRFQILEGMKVVRAVEALDDGSSKPTKEAKIANSGELPVETPFAVAKEPSPEDK